MGQEQLSYVAILAIRHERLDIANLKAIAKDFVEKTIVSKFFDISHVNDLIDVHID
jgi:hypothetical protein